MKSVSIKDAEELLKNIKHYGAVLTGVEETVRKGGKLSEEQDEVLRDFVVFIDNLIED